MVPSVEGTRPPEVLVWQNHGLGQSERRVEGAQRQFSSQCRAGVTKTPGPCGCMLRGRPRGPGWVDHGTGLSVYLPSKGSVVVCGHTQQV